MRCWLLILLCLLLPLAAQANPVMLDPSSLLAFGVVAFAALVVEAGVVALMLSFAGLAPCRFFIGFFFVNLAVFLFVFYPLLEHKTAPWFALEILIVALDAAAIKLLSLLQAFQGDDYRRVGWRLAGSAALVGNGISFFVGVIATGAPWIVHSTEQLS